MISLTDPKPAGNIFAIDPGNERSAFVVLEPTHGEPIGFGDEDNASVLAELRRQGVTGRICSVAIEMITGDGRPAGREVFETAFWAGRFAQLAESMDLPFHLLSRSSVAWNICKTHKGGDSAVRTLIIDRFGGRVALAKAKKCGRKRHDSCGCVNGLLSQDGPLARITGDVWQALAVGLTHLDKLREVPFYP